MTHLPPTLTWSLDSTASTTISVLKDVIRAATSDNVQALALIACEKFGATLAMCPETNKKMEDLIIKVSGPKFVRFMSAHVGYSANDCATQLSRSLAGVQFLGLAATLVSCSSIFEGANALSAMLTASASDKTLLPTVRQLKDLLGVMEHRVNRSGFTDLWVGYQILVFGGLSTSYESRHYPPDETRINPYKLRDYMQYPDIDGISKLVEAFRELNRLGEATAITIRATSCAPWVMAFTRWCLGIPPSTYLPDGEALLDQPASRVTLFTSNNAEAAAFEITIQRSIGSPAELLKSEVSPKKFSGMVTVECFGQMRCQEMSRKSSDTYRAMCQALPYALTQCCHLLRFSQKPNESATRLDDAEVADGLGHWTEYRTKAFPQEHVIGDILTRFLNSESQHHLKRLSEGHQISDLPLVQSHLRNLTETCACVECRLTREPLNRGFLGLTREPLNRGFLDPSRCCKKEFFSVVSLITADILALSLFEGPDTLLVRLDPGDRDDWEIRYAFRRTIHQIIKSSKPATCGVTDVLAWALELVGHSTEDVWNSRWVTSCSKGQAVYPRVFETGSICQPGYLVLYWAPGSLTFNRETYDRGIDIPDMLESTSLFDPVSTQLDRPVSEPLNLVPDMRMEWKVTRCDGYLEVFPVCGQHIGHAFAILSNVAKSVILRGCSHDSASPLKNPDPCAMYKVPYDLGMDSSDLHPQLEKSPGPEMRVGVVAVDGDAGLRMFAMSWPVAFPNRDLPKFVIRNDSCLQCCLDLCRKAGCLLVLC